ncbi:enzymatic polyprotein [Labeo rohita]|uniref:ribonuclease H n=1 Tax=Labeo rohita TaxID=84645 RepID=A0ABQ8MV02_LABRO|nr:enzymatic polyprotein [Labeo rohita]
MAVRRGGIRRFPRWRKRLRCTCARKTPPPGGAAQDSRPGLACAASGQAASTLHAMAILQVYQAKVLKDLHEGVPNSELLHELRSATDYALQAMKVTAQALGRAMSTMVVQERHLWLNLAKMRDAEKVHFLEAPISQAGLFGDIVEAFAQQFSAQAPAQLRRSSNLRLLRAEEGPLRERLRPRNLPVLQLDPPKRLRSIPETSSPGKRDRLTCPGPHSTRERVLDSASTRQTATTWSIKEQFPSSLGVMHSTSGPLYDGQMLCPPFRTCGHTPTLFPHVLTQRAHSDDLPSQADPLFGSFAFEGRAYQYKVLPFGLSLSPGVFTKVAEAALAPLREMGIRILNYLDDWLILAHSWDLVCIHRDMVLNHLAQLGLRVNWEKSKLSPAQRISFLGVELDSVSSDAPGAHGILSRGHTAGFDAHETAATLASYPSPEIGVAPERVSDASKTGWGATCNGQAASGVWTGPRLHWHINCLELLAVLLALRSFRPMIQGKHVLVRSDNTATVAYINHQGGVRSFRMSQLARHLLLWSQHRLRCLHATHIPGEANRFARRRVEAPPPVGPTDLGLIRPGTSRFLCLTGIHPLPAVVRSNRGPPRYRCTGTQLAEGPAQVCVSPSEPHHTDTVQSREDKEQILLVAPFWPKRTWISDLVLLASAPSLGHSSEKGSPFPGEGHNLAPVPRSLEPPPMVPGRDQEDFRDLSPSVVNTLLQARAPSTRRLYGLKWRIFVNWCSSRGRDPRRCGIESVLSFLQEGLDRHLSASTLKVHVAAISANHDLVGGRSVGKRDLIIRFLRGARRLNPPQPHLIPSWDLAVVLQGLQQDPFEPLQDQVVTLQAISPQEDDPNLTPLCPVRALHIYMEQTQPFRRSDQLFVCYGGQQKGKAVSKQRISHWLVNAIRTAYQARGLPCPLGVRAHSTRGVAASAALANRALLTDICRAAGWATPNTFAKFYNLRMEPVSARVLNTNS